MIHMNWEAIAAGAELLAATGGILAVIYLAFQIRLNTRAVRSATIDSWVTAVALGNDAMTYTDEFISLAKDSYYELDGHQRLIFHRALAQMHNAMEALYFHHKNGVVDEPFFAAKIRTMIVGLQIPGVSVWWSERGRDLYDPRFVEYVEARLQEE
jgi:hypothetical protein